ncbi:MAG: ribosome biogenesis GTP-binding protein YihA/YsxC [Syntrophales bacterium]
MKILSAQFVKTATLPIHYPDPLGPEVAFAGRSNVGKSSLINVLTNRNNLAKASRTPGRTQAVNFFMINDQLSFVDLPGYGFAKVPEQIRMSWGPMVETYLKERNNLRLLLLIMDVRRDVRDDDRNFLMWMEENQLPWQLVLTKADKLSKNQAMGRQRIIEEQAGISGLQKPLLFSALNGQGKDQLWGIIKEAAGI